MSATFFSNIIWRCLLYLMVNQSGREKNGVSQNKNQHKSSFIFPPGDFAIIVNQPNIWVSSLENLLFICFPGRFFTNSPYNL